MTLNITVGARWRLVQSSDFRLSNPDNGSIVSNSAQKQFVLHYHNWSGLLCFTGVARVGRFDTANWIGQQLAHSPGYRSSDKVVEILQRNGSRQLKSINPRHRYLSLMLACYKGSIPRIYLLSNFQRMNGIFFEKPLDKLVLSTLRPRGPRVIVTGWDAAVDDSEIDDLKARSAGIPNPASLRRAVAFVNRSSAPRSGGRISEECVVSHLNPDGSGEAQVFGNFSNTFVPSLFISGQNTSEHASGAFKQAGQSTTQRLVAASWSRNGEAAALLTVFRDLSRQSDSGWE